MRDATAPGKAEAIVSAIRDLPTLPTVVMKITRQVADPRTSASDINETLSSDPSLSAKVLQLVNSPFYGFPRRITSITYAVVILGFNTIRNLAMSVFVFDSFRQGEDRGLDLRGLWKHQVATALAAAELVRRREPRLEDDAFMAGLLHDLGKAIMEQHRKEDLRRVAERVAREDELFLDAERAENLGYDHAGLGGTLLERWNLPENVVRAVRFHHDPAAADDATAAFLARAVNVADVLARLFGVGSGGDRRLPAAFTDAWAELGLDDAALEKTLRRLAGEWDKVDSFFL